MYRSLVKKLLLLGVAGALSAAPGPDRWALPGRANPFLPGYYADPTVITYGNKHYIYVTLEPWGGRTLGCWESDDFKQWTYRELNWPTKEACTSPTSMGAMVWAPAVVRGKDGRFYMYVSVGSEIWAGVAEHPLGPWQNALGTRPLVSADFDRRYHMIDADVFIDDDGRAYLYWGSGWNWVNGECFAVELADDMLSFVGDVQRVTPSNYFEGPTMLKHDGRYYLTYSNGKTISDTYEVRYAVGDHPLGPFKEGKNSPILTTNRAKNVVSPGHHGFYRRDGQVYIVYHRHRIPFVEGTAFRQVCVDPLHFTADGEIAPIAPTHVGPPLVQRRLAPGENLAGPARKTRASTSSQLADETGPAQAFDDNYATRWAPAGDDAEPWLQVDLGRKRPVRSVSLRLEYAWRPYRFLLESSDDGRSWHTVHDARQQAAQGSPIELPVDSATRHLRLRFTPDSTESEVGVLEWIVR
jgi:arabinoxylan arabinofuranohydrolase